MLLESGYREVHTLLIGINKFAPTVSAFLGRFRLHSEF
jgi:hypothetical protein